MTKVVGILVVLILASPWIGLMGVAALINTASISCASNSLTVGAIPDSLTAKAGDGQPVNLNRQQLTHAATIISVGARTAGVGRTGTLIAIMAALTESTLRMLANPTAYPESGGYPNDGNGSDHDSLGFFQMRHASGWGTVAELMSPEYQASAFFGGTSGPNAGSPRGLLDIVGWQLLDPGEAAQAVEVSAYPDRYQNYQPVAEAILSALTRPSLPNANPSNPAVPETERVVFPLPVGSYTSTDSFGWRTDPVTGAQAFHAGSDLAARAGTPILAVADGIVTFAGERGTYGGLIIIESTVGGELVASYYAHMYQDGLHVTAGERVAAGQHIGDVGSAGKSTGPHLHLEIHPGGAGEPPLDALGWLATHGAAGLDNSAVASAGCTSEKAA